ncbi:FtsX-like permease family protein [Nocardioides endophyticus]|uniref:FtsX-like permease family protein n=1 Tax=Nocardioides endophyticus TaxID=1353775 RepID=UPI0031E83A38
MVTVVVASLVTLFILQSSFTLNGKQVAERDLGRFSYSVSLPLNGSPQSRTATIGRAVQAATEAGAEGVEAELTSFDLSPSLPGTPRSTYQERDWTAAPYPERFVLVDGRWPSRPGEVAVSNEIARRVPGEQLSRMPLLSGLAKVDVVGIVEDRYATRAGRILAAPGTFDSFDLDVISTRFEALDLRGSLWWSTGGTEKVLAAVESVVPETAAEEVKERTRILGTVRPDFASAYPLGWKIPSLALPLLSALVVFGAAAYRLQRTMSTLRSIGLRRRQVTTAVATTAVVLVISAAIVGGAVGATLGLALRPVLTRFMTAPLAPYPDLVSTLALLLAMSLLGCAVGVVWVHASQQQINNRHAAATRRVSLPSAGSRASARRVAAGLVAGFAIMSQGLPLGDVSAAMTWIATLTIGLFLLTPDLLNLCLRFVSTTHLRGLLAHRHLVENRGRSVVSILVVAAAWGFPLAFATVLATMIQTDEADRVAQAGVDQVRILSEGAQTPPTETVELVARALGPDVDRPVIVSELETSEDHVGVPVLGVGGVAAVDSPDDLERLNGHELTRSQVAVLNNGGLLYRGSAHGDVLELSFASGSPIAQLPAAPVDLDPVWEVSTVGYVLKATATDLDLPVVESDVVFTSVSASSRADVERALDASGLDPYFVKVFHAPDPVRAPPIFYLALVALSLMVVGVSMLVVRAHAASLRRLLGSLVAVGVPASWTRQVVLLELGIITTVAASLAIVIAGPISATALSRLPGFDFTIPWDWLLVIIGSCLVACLAGGWLATTRLRPSDRTAI